MAQWWVAMAQAVAMGARLFTSYDSITVALALSHENNGRTSEERKWGNVFQGPAMEVASICTARVH